MARHNNVFALLKTSRGREASSNMLLGSEEETEQFFGMEKSGEWLQLKVGKCQYVLFMQMYSGQ